MDNIFNNCLDRIYFACYFGNPITDFGMCFMKGQSNTCFTLALVPLIEYEGTFLVAVFSYLISAFFMHFQKRILAYRSKVGQNISEKIKNKRLFS